MIFAVFGLMLCMILPLVVFIGQDRLRIEKDYFFIGFLIFAVLYTVVAPALVQLGEDATAVDGNENYPHIQMLVVALFLFPLGFAYRLLGNQICNQGCLKLELYLSESKVILFCIFFLGLEVAFTVLALNSNMYVRRIGTEVIAEVVGDLDMFSLVVLRTHDLIILPVIALLAILMPSIKRQTKGWVHMIAKLTFVTIVCSFVLYALMNSRALLVFLAVALLFAQIFKDTAKIVFSRRLLLLLAVGVLYGVVVVSNIRNHGPEAGASEILNPISFMTEPDSNAFNKWEWTQRLDCVNLIAKMDGSLQRHGYEWGNAWERPLVTMFGQLVGLDRATEYKLAAITTAKTYLIEEHTDIALNDYPSCMVTDLWGNFWIYGLPVAAILIALSFALLRYGLTESLSPTGFVISLAFAFYFVTFEKEFIDWLFGWVKLIPAIALLVILNPIKKITAHSNKYDSGVCS